MDSMDFGMLRLEFVQIFDFFIAFCDNPVSQDGQMFKLLFRSKLKNVDDYV